MYTTSLNSTLQTNLIRLRQDIVFSKRADSTHTFELVATVLVVVHHGSSEFESVKKIKDASGLVFLMKQPVASDDVGKGGVYWIRRPDALVQNHTIVGLFAKLGNGQGWIGKGAVIVVSRQRIKQKALQVEQFRCHGLALLVLPFVFLC